MKKLAYFAAAVAMSMGVVACDNYEEPNPPAQSNPAEPIFQTDQVVATTEAAAEATPVDLLNYNNEGALLPLTVITAPDVPSGYTVEAVMEIAKDESFSKTFDVATSTVVNGDNTYTIQVAPDDLNGIYFANISKSPKQNVIWYRLRLYVTSNNTRARVGGPDAYYGVNDMNILPLPSDFVIEDNYYLLGTVNGWSVPNALKFDHSDKDPYDDPAFTILVNISAEECTSGWWWKIIPASTFVTGDWAAGENTQFGPVENGDESMEGMLTGNDPGAGCLKPAVPGPYLLTINMEEGSYKFILAIENLYTPGNANGWSQTASQLLYTYDYVNYQGYAHCNGEFKFTSQPDWNGTNFGAGAAEGTLDTDGSAGNLSVPADGLYWLKANIASLTWSADLISTMGIIGGFNGWSASEAMTPSADFLTWTIENVEFKAGDEWKFRANDDWGINLGGEFGNLTQDGNNLVMTEDGKYDIVLHLNILPYSCEVIKK